MGYRIGTGGDLVLLPESLALVNTSALVSSKRRTQARHGNIVKVIVKFIRKGI
jgi:hypothetical protein